MTDLTLINKWCAEKCGIKLIKSLDELECGDFVTGEGGKAHWPVGTWTIEDARCMEILEAKFSMCTIIDHCESGWSVECFVLGLPILSRKILKEYKNKMYLLHDGSVKKHRIVHALPERFAPEHIKQAKISCITKIYAAEQ